MQQINRGWLKYIDLSLIDIYPIQFANCDRLQKNDAVYIFDEVGSGKTISSGLMALDYLYNNSGKVLVITTNALAKKGRNSEYGQFLADWYDKLPFKQLKLTERIDIVNNHYANLNSNEKYGLVIVDEAQLFLNDESLRYKYLSENIKAEKIVFLTATPIKSSKNDLYVYVRLASLVTNKKLSDSWINQINTNNKQPEEIICSTFNVAFPVTRYFKDTIMSLNVEGYQKRQARRLTPQLWQYGSDVTKTAVLLRMIKEKHDNDVNNRFVVFTRLVDKEAKMIEGELKKAGFTLYDNNVDDKEIKTYKVITGSNAYELSEYSRTSNLPTVLILTYQIAEQGINLPGYNHVVNYHVSAFPSALEQRFGRIDRMGKNGSRFTDINMCFLISKDYLDTNTWNFYCAITTYLYNLISYLPSKNTILSEEIIQAYGEIKDHVKAYVDKISGLLNQTEQIDFVINYFKSLNDEETEDKSKIECCCDDDLFEFIDDNGIIFDINQEKEKAVKEFVSEVKSALDEFSRVFSNKNEISSNKYKVLVKTVGDKIFYSEGIFSTNIRTVDAINECGKFISEQRSFKSYSSVFRNYVKLPVMVFNYLDELNVVFEKKFIENDFNFLFPYGGYKNIFENFFIQKNISAEDKQLIICNSNTIVTILPIFKMFSMYERALQDMAYTQKNEIRIKFDFNPFKSAFCKIYIKIRKDIRHLGLSDDFFNRYFSFVDEYDSRGYRNLYRWSEKLYTIEYDENTRIVKASNWYKLAYHYTRKEVACFMGRVNLRMDENENFYKQKEELIRFLSANYNEYSRADEIWNGKCHEYTSAYKVAMDGEDSNFNLQNFLHERGFCSKPDQPEIIRVYKDAAIQLKEVIQRRDKERNNHQSLFNHLIFTDSGNYRKHSMHICIYDSWKVYCCDIWTQGIANDIKGWTYQDCTLDKIAKLPISIGKISIF